MREPRRDWSPLWVNFKILDEPPHLFIFESPLPRAFCWTSVYQIWLNYAFQQVSQLRGPRLSKKGWKVAKFISKQISNFTFSHCADHCWIHALSATDPEFYQPCRHKHDVTCDRCEALETTLTKIEATISSKSIQLRYDFLTSNFFIWHYKCIRELSRVISTPPRF